MVQIGMNALFQSVENLYNTLPDPESVFVLELPGIGKNLINSRIHNPKNFIRSPRSAWPSGGHNHVGVHSWILVRVLFHGGDDTFAPDGIEANVEEEDNQFLRTTERDAKEGF